MNLEYFISKRLITTKSYKSSISSPIIKIAITAIAIGIIMMIVSVATGIGLQNKIREKVAAFDGHIIITNYDDNQSEVTKEPISTKGPRLTAEISIAGRSLVLLPFSNKISISQKIKSEEERNRMREELLKLFEQDAAAQ